VRAYRTGQVARGGSGFLERQRLWIERRRQVGHVEGVLAEAEDVPARIGVEGGDQSRCHRMSVRGHAGQDQGCSTLLRHRD